MLIGALTAEGVVADDLYVKNRLFQGATSGSGIAIVAHAESLLKAFGVTAYKIEGSTLVLGDKRLELSQGPGGPMVSAKSLVEALGGKIAVNKELGVVDLLTSTEKIFERPDVVARMASPNLAEARALGQLTTCKSNLKNIGVALELYSVDHNGKYPQSLDEVVPKFLETVPECPAAGKVTYRVYFGPTAKANTQQYQDYYYVECAGHYHKGLGVPADFPAFSLVYGLIENPNQSKP